MAYQILAPLKSKASNSFTKSFCIKDCSVKFALNKMPWHATLLTELINLVPEKKKFLTVDILEQSFTSGNINTCRDTNWHVDGLNNNYLIVAFGDHRTMYHKESLVLSNIADLAERNQFIVDSLSDSEDGGFEIPDGVPILYTSDDIHKGRIATPGTKRVLVRLCMSDYLCPKNKVLVYR